ncbi:MAG: DUF3185 family protein [Planctomycetes bacterium]|nr:DUF3185 family protein [Planctomycetota bacterium]
MLKTGLFGAGGLMLAIGIALWVYGQNLEPTVGEAITNVFDQDFSDKRDLLIYSGIGLTIVGAITLLSGFIYGFKSRS